MAENPEAIEMKVKEDKKTEENGIGVQPAQPKAAEAPVLSCEDIAKACLRAPRKVPCASQVLTTEEIAQEIFARAEKKRQYFPDGVDVLVAMKSSSELRNFNQDIPQPPPPKMTKVREKSKVTLDASELLSILQDGAETHYVQKPKPKVWSKGRGIKDFNIDPELEKSLAMQQLMEFSRKRGRRKPEANNNDSSKKEDKPKKKEVKKAANRELSMLLQDEGAVNMLYSVEKGETESKERLLSSKRRLKKVLKKKAEEVKEAILGSTGNTGGVTLRNQRQERTRKASVESVESEHSVNNDFNFPAPAEASKIIRRHSSSSSYSSRGSSPRRLSIDFEKTTQIDIKEEKSPIKMSERTEKLIEMKCKELNLQKEHSEIIRQLVQDKKNGLKERLQNKFSSKFKAAVSTPPPKIEPVTPGVSEAKPVWKVVEEDWESFDENSDMEVEPAPQNPPVSPLKPGIHEIIKQGLASVIKQSEKQKRMGTKNTSAQKTQANQVDLKPKSKENQNEAEKSPELSPPKKIFLVNSVPAVKPQDSKQQESNSVHKSPEAKPVEQKPPEQKQVEQKPKQETKVAINDIKGPFAGTDVRLEILENIVRINIAPLATHLPQSFNAKVLGELCQAFDYISAANTTSAIVLNSSAVKGVYCYGIDLPSLLSEDLECRKTLASSTASALRDFICKLCMIGRPVLTAVSGKAIGLGVVMLAYCDYVIADETATFYTPYSRLGYLPEGAATLALPHVIGHRRATSLLLGCTQLDSSEAEQCGLVSKVVPRIVLESRLMEVANTITQQSVQSMISTKALLMHTMRTRLPGALNMEVRLLEQHWTGEDCQRRIKELKENPFF